MMRSSEEVLLVVKQVRYRKSEGVLYLMSERLAWMLHAKNVFSVSHHYVDIKIQKISPDNKDKVQLQVVLHDGSASTFQFSNKKGHVFQKQDRDVVKELLQQLLSKFRSKISMELEAKNKLLHDEPELFQLYKDLVVSQIISADEFWANHCHKLSTASKDANNKQKTGVSPAFLSHIKPQTDGANGLKYNLTSDIIESVFKTYPMDFQSVTRVSMLLEPLLERMCEGTRCLVAVRRKHAECVPHSLSESEFWTRFFQSQYFHRDRINISSKDIFSDCAKKDEEDISLECQKIPESSVDLTQNKGMVVDDEYRGMLDDSRASTSLANQCLIRRFNQHSSMVLRASLSSSVETGVAVVDGACAEVHSSSNCDNIHDLKVVGGKEISSRESDTISNGHISILSANSELQLSRDVSPRSSNKLQLRLQEEARMKDLVNEDSVSGFDLHLENLERYFQGPAPSSDSIGNIGISCTTNQQEIDAFNSFSREISHWRPNSMSLNDDAHALCVIGELSPGGTLMPGRFQAQQDLYGLVPENVQLDIKNTYSALCELLRHFWSCFPVTDKCLEEKLSSHLEELVQAAFDKYHQWQIRRTERISL